MRTLIVIFATLFLLDAAIAQKSISFPTEDGGVVFADLYGTGEKGVVLKSPILFIVARDDANSDGLRLPGIREQYERAPQPKELIVLDGSAHAQYLFQTDQGNA